MARPAVLKIDIISDLNSRGFADADDALRQVGRGAQIAATAIGAGLVAGGLKAVNAASRLGESTNAVTKVFGDATSQVTEFGETAAKKVGLSQAAFQQLATSTGSLLTNFGYSNQEAAAATTELATRAADMASVFDKDVGQALEAINAGLRGESEPLRAFGVNLNDAALKAKALELGLYSGAGALDANARAAAAQAIIMEQTAATAGDFADTSDSWANRQRTLAATIEDTSAQLGQSLMPTAEAAAGVLQTLADWTSRNTGTVKVLAAVMAAFVATVLGATAAVKAYQTAQLLWAAATKAVTIATQGLAVAQRVLNAVMRANPIGIVITVVALLAGALVTAYQKSDTFRAAVDKVAAILRGALKSALDTAKAAVQAVSEWLGTAWGKSESLRDALGKIAGVISGTFTSAWNTARTAIESVVGWLQQAWAWVQKFLDNPVGNIVGRVRGNSASAAAPAVAAYTATTAGPVPLLRAGTTQTRAGSAPAGAAIVVNVNGALDPDAVARQIKRILTTHDRRTGAAWLPA